MFSSLLAVLAPPVRTSPRRCCHIGIFETVGELWNCTQVVWVEEHDKRSFLLDLMDAAGLGAKDLDGEVG